MTAITLEHINKTYGKADGNADTPVQALTDIAFKMTSGDVLAILGPSGCGKSTLLRVIAGLIPPDSGRVLYDNVLLSDIPMHERGIGMVFQEGALIPHWKARENVGFFLSLRRREQEVPEKLKQIARITGIGLDKLLDKRPPHLSGGEQQRVSIARALSRDLRVLLFDEPFSNLDAKYRTEARVELRRLLNAFPVTAVYVTHDQTEAVALAQRIAVMRAGHIEQIGTYQQLYSSPQNLFVAEFIGTPPINRFRGRAEDGHWQGEHFGGFALRSDLEPGSPVILGIRAEHIQRVGEGAGVAAVVEEVEPHLAERLQRLIVRAGGEQWRMSIPLEPLTRVGEIIHCAFSPQEVLFFDARNGVRIG
jgi:multiple sugar transport system ATP-binding protein